MSYKTIAPAQGGDEWLEIRRKAGIGASESPAILGVSAFAGPLNIYAKKIGAIGPGPETQAQRLGKRQERLILEEMAMETGRTLTYPVGTYQSIKWPFMIASPDGLLDDEKKGPGVAEAKSTGWAPAWTDGPPQSVWIQVQHQLAVMGLRWGSVGVMLKPTEVLWRDIERDDSFIENELAPTLETFWQAVQTETPVDQDVGAKARSAIDALWPKTSAGRTVNLPGRFLDLDEERTALISQKREVEGKLKSIENEIRAAMKEAESGVLPNGVVYSLKQVEMSETIRKAFSYRRLNRRGKKSWDN